jgi:ABC-2 type transport system permease protein
VSEQALYQPTSGLWGAVSKLLRLRLLILLSGFRRARLRRKIGTIILVALLLAFLGFVFYLSWELLIFLQSPQIMQYFGDFEPLLAGIPGLVLAGAFLGILLTSFGVLLQALYLAGDMDFLLSAPLPIRAVFLTKLLQAVLPNFALICLFALPVLYGLGISFDYHWSYYPLVLILLSALALAAAGLSSLFVMGVVRVFPARRVAEILGFLGAIFSFLCSQSGQFARFGEVSQEQATQALNMVSRFDVPWSPLSWAGRGLAAMGAGEWASGLGYLLPTLVLAGAIFALSLFSAERLYYSGWASLQSKGKKVKARRSTRPERQAASLPWGAFLEKRIPAGVRAILFKDWLVLRRDLRNMSQLVTPLIFGVIYAIMFFRDGGPRTPQGSELPAWAAEAFSNMAVYFNVGIALFVGWMLLARLAGMGFSQEGKQYWLLKSAPVSTAILVAAKYLVAYLPTLALGWIFLLAITLVQRAGLGQLLFTMPVVALCVAGNAGLNLAFGITGANFTWEDPRHMQKGGQGCLAALATMLYLPFCLLLFFGPPILLVALGLPEALGQVIGLIAGGGFSLACAIIPLLLAGQRVPRLAES